MRTKLKYRALKSSWGIAIDIEAEHFEIEQDYIEKEKDILLENGHRLRLEIKLPEEDIAMIKEGLILALQHIKDRKFLIQVHKLEFALTDFQSEGLIAAFYKWAIKHFEIEGAKELTYSYDKENNKYVFEY